MYLSLAFNNIGNQGRYYHVIILPQIYGFKIAGMLVYTEQLNYWTLIFYVKQVQQFLKIKVFDNSMPSISGMNTLITCECYFEFLYCIL